MPDAAAARRMSLAAATRSHMAEVAAIETVCFSDPWSEGSFRQALDNPGVFFRVATEGAGGPVLGYVVAWFAAGEGEIANVAVAPWARGRGIGGMLLDAAIGAAGGRGAEALYLDVRESNARARALYDSRGFVEVGRRRRYYRRPAEDAIVLRLGIGSGTGGESRP
ncbi:MAG: ribosomal protein S18-alanine N-acetyltransferase [Gemmatimonadaceae bacterium]